MAVSPEKIHNAGEAILIAGGWKKVNALHGVLTGEYPDAPAAKEEPDIGYGCLDGPNDAENDR